MTTTTNNAPIAIAQLTGTTCASARRVADLDAQIDGLSQLAASLPEGPERDDLMRQAAKLKDAYGIQMIGVTAICESMLEEAKALRDAAELALLGEQSQ